MANQNGHKDRNMGDEGDGDDEDRDNLVVAARQGRRRGREGGSSIEGTESLNRARARIKMRLLRRPTFKSAWAKLRSSVVTRPYEPSPGPSAHNHDNIHVIS